MGVAATRSSGRLHAARVLGRGEQSSELTRYDDDGAASSSGRDHVATCAAMALVWDATPDDDVSSARGWGCDLDDDDDGHERWTR
jgi:hypothetical protein